MFWTFAIVCAAGWTLGMAAGVLLGGAIHALLAVAAASLLFGTFRAWTTSQRRRRRRSALRGPGRTGRAR